jgi:hypothetical protein
MLMNIDDLIRRDKKDRQRRGLLEYDAIKKHRGR